MIELVAQLANGLHQRIRQLMHNPDVSRRLDIAAQTTVNDKLATVDVGIASQKSSGICHFTGLT